MKYLQNSIPNNIDTHTDTQASHSSSTPAGALRRLRRGLMLLVLGAIVLAACGSDGEPVSAGDTSENGIEDAADSDTGDTGQTDDSGDAVQDRDENGDLEDYEEAIADGAEDPATDFVQPIDEPLDEDTAALWQRLIEQDVVAPGEILDPKPWEIVEAFAVSADADEILVRYSAGSPPCTQSRATVVETDTTIEVSLEVGLHPNVAAMSCIAQVVDTEIVVPLSGAVADREIVAVQP